VLNCADLNNLAGPSTFYWLQLRGAYASVCISSMTPDGKCYATPSSYTAAKNSCQAHGARLCSSFEIFAAAESQEDDTCGVDHQLVWTSTTCSNPVSYLAVNRSSNSSECMTAASVATKPSLRCCGDDGQIVVDKGEDHNNNSNSGSSGGGGGFGSGSAATLSIALTLTALALAAALVCFVVVTRSKRERKNSVIKSLFSPSKTNSSNFHDADDCLQVCSAFVFHELRRCIIAVGSYSDTHPLPCTSYA
jgi:hypothetical protein